MKVALAQMDVAWHDRRANYDKVRSMAERARENGAELLVLPEMFHTGFSLDTSVTPEGIDGPTSTFMRELAKEMKMAVVGGFVLQREGERPQNVSLAVDSTGRDLALYAKVHLIALLDEHKPYGPGTLPAPFDLNGFRASCFVCYDLRFPELFRTVAAECTLMMVVASWPSARQMHWDVLTRARAVENQCYLLAVNRVGEGGGYHFSGGSAIYDPYGEILAHGGDAETVVMADIDPKRAAEVRSSMPFLRDRCKHIFECAAQC